MNADIQHVPGSKKYILRLSTQAKKVYEQKFGEQNDSFRVCFEIDALYLRDILKTMMVLASS